MAASNDFFIIIVILGRQLVNFDRFVLTPFQRLSFFGFDFAKWPDCFCIICVFVTVLFADFDKFQVLRVNLGVCFDEVVKSKKSLFLFGFLNRNVSASPKFIDVE